MRQVGKNVSLENILYQNTGKGKGRGLSKTSKTFQKVRSVKTAVKTGNLLKACIHQGFAHYPHSYPQRYVNDAKIKHRKKFQKTEKLGKREKEHKQGLSSHKDCLSMR